MSTATARAAARADSVRGASRAADSVYDTLARMPREMRWEYVEEMSLPEKRQVFAASLRDAGTPYALWRDDPVAFDRMVLGQTSWSRQRMVLDAVPRHRRVAVPSGFATGKTLGAAKLVLWAGSVYPPGTAQALTVAPGFQRAKRQIWPEIRVLHELARLPGNVDMTQWKVPTRRGQDYTVAQAVATRQSDDDSLQGTHARGFLLLIVDEAGGISRQIGRSTRSLLTGSGTRMLAIGNPPTDDENSWFEELCRTDDVEVIQIPVDSTPNFTGEDTGPCRACPAEVPEHPLADHLVDREWEEETRRDYGADSAYYIAKAKANFPKNATRTAIPSSWVDASVERAAAGTDEPVTVRDRLTGQAAACQPAPGAWVRLGVDVAADGGDELAIGRAEGRIRRIVHTSSGAQNADSMKVAGTIKEQILEAVLLRKVLGTPPDLKLHVKIDVIGLGWAVHGLLVAWVREGILPEEVVIVAVDVREGIDKSRRKRYESSTMRPRRKRDEMWLTGRAELQPGESGEAEVLLDVDRQTAAQLSGPDYGTDSGGLTYIESKDSMRARGIPSPDRAEAILLAGYEPGPAKEKGSVSVSRRSLPTGTSIARRR